MCDHPSDCRCEIAVKRVYRELRRRNVPDIEAFDTASEVYRMHHPEVAPFDARCTVGEWLDENP